MQLKKYIVLSLLLVPCFCFSQTDRDECNKLFKQAKLLFDSADYQLAIKKLTAYKNCEAANTEDADSLLLQIYKTVNQQKNDAIIAKNKAIRNANIAIKLASDGLISQGYIALKDNPAMALDFAYSSIKLSYSIGAIDLIRDCLKKNPEWRKIIPKGSSENTLHIFDFIGDKTDYDPIAADSNFTKLVIINNSANNNKDSKELAVFNLETASKISSIKLLPTEEIITPPDMKTKLLAIKDNREPVNQIKIIDITSKSLEATLIKVKGIKAISFSNGYWPAFLTTSGDSLFTITKNSNNEVRVSNLGMYKEVNRPWPDSDGRFLILQQLKDVAALEIQNNKVHTQKSILEILKLDTAANIKTIKVYWAEKSKKFVAGVLYELNDESISDIFFVDLEINIAKSVYNKLQINSPMEDDLVFDVNTGLNRIAYTRNINENGYLKDVIVEDFNWMNDLNSPSRAIRLEMGKKAVAFESIKSLTIAPNGNYLIVNGTESGTSGTTTSIGNCTSWDLTPISQHSSLAPLPATIYYGNQLLKRVAYSNDSKRLLLFDYDNISHVFQVRTNAPPLFDQDVRTPDVILDRFWEPAITFTDNLECRIEFSKRGIEYIDLASEKRLDISKFISTDEEVIADRSVLGKKGQYLIITTKRGLVLKNDKIIRSVTLWRKEQLLDETFNVSLSNEKYCILNLKNVSYIYDNDLKLLDSVTHKSASFRHSWINSHVNTPVSFFAISSSWRLYAYKVGSGSKKYILVDSLDLSPGEAEMLYSFRFYEDYLITSCFKDKTDLEKKREKWPSVSRLYKLFPRITQVNIKSPELKNVSRNEDRYNNATFAQDLFLVNDTILCGIFKPKSWNRYFAMWNLKNNQLIKSFETKPGPIRYFIKNGTGKYGFYSLFEKDSIKIFSVMNNDLIKSVAFGTELLPPYLTVDSKMKWRFVGNPAFYQKLDQYLLRGGYDNCEELTNIRVPEETTLRINSILSTIK